MSEPRRNIPSALAAVVPAKVDVEAVKSRGWRENGILVIAEQDERLTDADRADVRRLGRKLYGDRT